MSSSPRGRSTLLKSDENIRPRNDTPVRRRAKGSSSGDSAGSTSNLISNGIPLPYPRSPVSIRPCATLLTSKPRRHASPMSSRIAKQRGILDPPAILPGFIDFKTHVPLTNWISTFNMDVRRFGESVLLLGTLVCAVKHFQSTHNANVLPRDIVDVQYWLVIEIYCLCIASFLHFAWTHFSFTKSVPGNQPPFKEQPPVTRPASPFRPSSPRTTEFKRFNRATFGYVWMSVPKNYRESSDDGVSTGLLLAPLLAMALVINSSRPAAFQRVLPAGWIIEAPAELHTTQSDYTVPQALLLSRFTLVNLSTLCSTVLLLHIYASCWFERRYSKSLNAKEGERTSVPRNEGRRALYYGLFTITISTVVSVTRATLSRTGVGIWQHLTIFETAIVSFFFQFCLYVALRMAHGGFSLGELGLVCFGATSLLFELMSVTMARLWPVTTPFIRTFRLPTPLLTFQIALVAGSLLTGFLLSPFLILSRSYAKRPAFRFRLPHENREKERNRRWAALGFYVGTLIIVVGLIGSWARWLLENRDPWLWVIYRLLEGRKKWHRPALLAYWGLLGCLSVAGWNRQLARSRKLWPRTVNAEYVSSPISQDSNMSQAGEASPSTAQPTQANALGMTFPNLPNLPGLPNLTSGVSMTHVATDLLDAADKHVPTLKLNARRKFFHGLAVIMFVPGVALDPAFTHLSLDVAFALFIFAEYIRYFAIYPLGVAIHLFMNEFLDEKDDGTAILSHFYLLTGCAGSLWLEGPSRLLQYTGILALGVGDAVASIVGKRLGRHRWSNTTSKTFEGTLAFVVSVILSAWSLRLLGFAEPFSTARYLLGVAVSAVLEALSDQNDNLTMPLYMWGILVLVNP